uniref:DUF1902 domain-containing protein n=1 Tax=Candidatus Kentrum sp. TUN TaxID=2126343 RepID=A0A450ZTH4_9GAMM|nr:MAG: protein of unknown function (DUF1902) [Candidatus Kentron sp. TUN]VFK53616.1 MAG: protein of unknown function (DUF1902) [Candidatus Kentron sp. TUN]VFK57065.1 MAG: protein of unknown function (DUF1902) [Candidatus Kentron sp. TUN]
MSVRKTIHVKAIWDNEAEVWVASSDDVPGLITEASASDRLMEKLRVLIPELLEVNGILKGSDKTEIPFYLLSERRETIHYRAA